MSKRPTFSSVVSIEEAEPGASPKTDAWNEIKSAPETDDAPSKRSGRQMTTYIDPDDHQNLRLFALKQRTSIQTIMLDALDKYLADNNAPFRLSRWTTRHSKK